MDNDNRTGLSKKMFLPFGMKLFISYLVLIMVPIFIFGYMANTILLDMYEKQMNSNLSGTLAQIRDNINYKLADTQRLSDILYFDENMPLEIMRYEEGWVSYQTTKKMLIPKFRQTVDSTNRKIWLSVYLKNETLPEIYNNDEPDTDVLAKGKHWELFHLRRIENKPWYKQFPQEDYGKTVIWQQVEDDSRFGRISLLRRLVDTRNPTKLETIGFMRISVYLSEIFESVDTRKIGSGSMLLILDENNRIVYGSGDHVPDLHSDYRLMDTSRFTVLGEQVPKLNWKLTALVPDTIIQHETRRVNLLTLVICLASFVVISLVALGVSRFFSKRVSKVVSILNLFQQGDFHKRFHYKGNDEFTMIAASLNKLGEQTEHLIKEVYATNLKKKEAELETLQAQINPHFLYNTLSSISRLAKFGQVDTQHQMVMNLAKFYRLSLNEGQTIIAIHKELEQTQAYLDIQKVKYGERMEVEFQIEPQIVKFVTVKLILQPFLENALQHAWRGDRIYIRVSGWHDAETDSIEFEIMDDGNGMSKDTLQQVNSAMDSAGAVRSSGRGRGYGIRNVNERIKLYFGKEYGVQLFSRLGIGTTVRIRIPLRHVQQQSTEPPDTRWTG
ncbi:sensor histidine kinase [Paenibacillus donghaensis]|uniref:cache domain-containing sensor histidine kinase n=1 Tax=Paenibacillus donghaensis TaxID=414771 RepID=UPI0018832F5B|nr:sensor histidine kinase [Paenibacillus donghaensis]MBE9913149.1 sensor histidine kinase [Paenibacillus donghaensis]